MQNLPFSVFRSHPVMREEAELSLGSPLWLEAAGRRWIAEQAPSEVSSGLLAQASQKGPRPWSSGRLGQAGPPERQGAVLGPSSGPPLISTDRIVSRLKPSLGLSLGMASCWSPVPRFFYQKRWRNACFPVSHTTTPPLHGTQRNKDEKPTERVLTVLGS